MFQSETQRQTRRGAPRGSRGAFARRSGAQTPGGPTTTAPEAASASGGGARGRRARAARRSRRDEGRGGRSGCAHNCMRRSFRATRLLAIRPVSRYRRRGSPAQPPQTRWLKRDGGAPSCVEGARLSAAGRSRHLTRGEEPAVRQAAVPFRRVAGALYIAPGPPDVARDAQREGDPAHGVELPAPRPPTFLRQHLGEIVAEREHDRRAARGIAHRPAERK